MNIYKEIKELNKKSTLMFKVGEKNINTLLEKNIEYEVVNNYMSKDFYFPNIKQRDLIVKFYGFPTDENDFCLSSYQTKLIDDDVFGVKVGDDFIKAKEKFISLGYVKIERSFAKGNLEISLDCDAYEKIIQINISLKSEYLGNYLY